VTDVTARFLSEEWLEAVRAAAASRTALGLTLRLEVAVGDAKFSAAIVDGALDALTSDGRPDADVLLTLPRDEAVAVARGTLAPSVAFMQGRMKTAGDPGLLLDLLARTSGPGFAAFRDEIAARTEF
jgi:putative sterol carrier protein